MQTDSAKISRLFHYASLWEVRADIGKVRTARKMLKELYGTRAVDYVFKYEFSTYDGLAQRAIEMLFTDFKDTAALYLFKGLHSANDTIVRNSIYFLGQLKTDGAGDTLLAMLEDKSKDSLAGAVIASLGTLKETKAVPAILKYIDHQKERMRLRVVTALGDIGDATALPALIKRLSDQSYTVKLAAVAVVAGFGKSAIEPLRKELVGAKSDEYRTILFRTLRNSYKQLTDSDKTDSLKKELAEFARPSLDSSYPALKEQARKMIDEVQGRAFLEPADLFMLPEEPERQ